MNTPRILWSTISLILALGAGFFAAKKFAPDSQGMAIRTYNVPAGRAEEVKNVLNRMFAPDKNDGSAQIFGSSTLIVKGPPAYLAGIGQLVSQVSDKQQKLHSIHFDYWLVRGENAEKSNAEQIAPLAPVLNSINSAQGKKKFALMEHIGFNSLDRREVSLRGAFANVKNVSRETEAGIEIMTDISTHALGDLKVNTLVKSGEFVILGENSMQPKARDIADGKGNTEDEKHGKEIYHIIRAEILP